MATKFTDDNFEEDVLKSDKPVLVDFWAEWCGPCLMLGPVIDELAKDLGDKVKIGKLNVDENQKTSQIQCNEHPNSTSDKKWRNSRAVRWSSAQTSV